VGGMCNDEIATKAYLEPAQLQQSLTMRRLTSIVERWRAYNSCWSPAKSYLMAPPAPGPVLPAPLPASRWLWCVGASSVSLWCSCHVNSEQRAANSSCRNRRPSIGAACSAQARKKPGRISWTPCCPLIRIRNLPLSFPHHRASQHIHRIACAMLIVPHRQLRVRHPSQLHHTHTHTHTHTHVSARWERAKVCPPISHYGNVGDDRAGRRMVGRDFDGRTQGERCELGCFAASCNGGCARTCHHDCNMCFWQTVQCSLFFILRVFSIIRSPLYSPSCVPPVPLSPLACHHVPLDSP